MNPSADQEQDGSRQLKGKALVGWDGLAGLESVDWGLVA